MCHVMPLHWFQHHVMWTPSLMEPLYSLHHDDQHAVQHEFWSCDAIGIGVI